MTRFVVDLGSLKLSEEQKSSISSAIQGVVLTQLGEQHHPLPGYYGHFPREWLGFILREKFDELQGAVKDVASLAKR